MHPKDSTALPPHSDVQEAKELEESEVVETLIQGQDTVAISRPYRQSPCMAYLQGALNLLEEKALSFPWNLERTTNESPASTLKELA